MKKTTTKKHPPKNNSLFTFVMKHIGRDGVYDESGLPDQTEIPYTWGNEDAEMFSPHEGTTCEMARQEILMSLKAWLTIPSASNKEDLYNLVLSTPMIIVFKSLSKALLKEKLPFELVKLADEWLHEARHREVIKFAYLLCGVIGLDKIRTLYSRKLYDDLFKMAICEEFTLYLCTACYFSYIRPQQKIWYLLRHTNGWGKVFTLSLADFNTEQKQMWLLMHGLELRIFWPPVAPLIISGSRLTQRLQTPSCTYDFYKYAMNAISQYLLFLTPDESQEQYKLSSLLPRQVNFNVTDMITNILRLAEPFMEDPKNVTDVLSIAEWLRGVIADENWDIMEPNTCHLLIGKCEQIIYQRDWLPVINEELFDENGVLDADVAELASGIYVDIWDRVFTYLCAHPTDPTAISFCLHPCRDKDLSDPTLPALTKLRVQKVIDYINKNEIQVVKDEQALVMITSFIEDYPGSCTGMLILALTSLSEGSRGLAALTLTHWEASDLTPAIKLALIKAQQLTHNPFIAVVIEQLLNPVPEEPFEYN